jgi:hypothetical protein
VVGVCCAHGETPDLNLLAGIDLGDLFEATPAEQAAGAARDDDGYRPTQALERGKVKVIVVEVRDEYPVERVELASVCRCRTPEVRHAVAEHRVGQYPRAV